MQLPATGNGATRPRRVGDSASPPGSLVIVNLDAGSSFIFRFFPEDITSSGKADWKPQHVSTRTAPLFYAGRQPRELQLGPLWLDNAATGDVSVTDEIAQLFELQQIVQGRGAPPALLARWGDNTFRGVLTEMSVKQQHFTREGSPLRAEVNLSLLELQDEPAQQPYIAPPELFHYDPNVVALRAPQPARPATTPATLLTEGRRRVIGGIIPETR